MTEDEEHVVAHAIRADAEAVVTRAEGMHTLLTGIGVAAALLGASLLVFAAKSTTPSNQAATPAVTAPKSAEPATGTVSSAAPAVTERDFMSRPEFKSAEYQGRLIADPDGLRFDTATSAFALAKYDPESGRMVPDLAATLAAARFTNDLAFCRSIPGTNLFKCWVLDHGAVVDLEQKP